MLARRRWTGLRRGGSRPSTGGLSWPRAPDLPRARVPAPTQKCAEIERQVVVRGGSPPRSVGVVAELAGIAVRRGPQHQLPDHPSQRHRPGQRRWWWSANETTGVVAWPPRRLREEQGSSALHWSKLTHRQGCADLHHRASSRCRRPPWSVCLLGIHARTLPLPSRLQPLPAHLRRGMLGSRTLRPTRSSPRPAPTRSTVGESSASTQRSACRGRAAHRSARC